MNQIQAKESTEIPKNVYDRIISEFKRNKIKNIQMISIPKMKTILKKLRLQQYYEHIPHIISKMTGRPPPTLSREVEEKIKVMFRSIQEPFTKYCPKDRTNFLSYSYVLHKFFQLLEMDEFVQYFPLLKSREKLRLQDKIWKRICDDLKWQFYPSL
ncbi:MAG: late transcription factor VLTF3-like protein [Edafosvirus sp.]|uniref:Late transcription factor VLTF3-like protein n=1 Tax=Edafosvirus sp. TaxID=2487765 RepID=A0A3G4ZW82_9VIRU|nr:MAG: late transcription factor VLTF3-like protein [Edafosvirus sp.]